MNSNLLVTQWLVVALAVLDNFQLALPAAIYSVSMYIAATLFGLLVLRRTGPVIRP